MDGVCNDGTEGRIISMADAASVYPGFKFSPSNAELIAYYLTKKLEGLDKSVEQLIHEVDISAHEPWDLPGDNLADGYTRKCSGSYNSDSAEQIHSSSNSSHQKYCDGNEDFYTDILKDDIVKLDESSVSATRNILPTVPINPEAVLMSQDSQNLVQDFMSPIPPFHGTTNRRIRLRRQKPESSSTIALEIKASHYSAEKAGSLVDGLCTVS